MKLTNFTLAALAFTFFLSCSNSNKSGAESNDSNAITVDTGITENNNAAKLDSSNINFLRNAAISGMADVEISNKIIQLGSTDDILLFAKTMVKNHDAANKALAKLASKKSFTLPKTLTENQIQSIKQLETFREDGKNEFFVHTLIQNHQNTIDNYVQAAKSTDPDIAAFAELTKPKLEQEYVEIKKIEKKILASKAGQGEDPLKKSDQRNLKK